MKETSRSRKCIANDAERELITGNTREIDRQLKHNFDGSVTRNLKGNLKEISQKNSKLLKAPSQEYTLCYSIVIAENGYLSRAD